MVSPSFEDVAQLVAEHAGVEVDQLAADTDLVADLGIIGLDFDELIEEFSSRFDTDTAGYLWYFHSREDGVSPGSFLIPPPNDRVERIPVTVQLLVDSARAGRWLVEYPPHQLPRRRWDLALDVLLLVLFLLFVLVRCSALALG